MSGKQITIYMYLPSDDPGVTDSVENGTQYNITSSPPLTEET